MLTLRWAVGMMSSGRMEEGNIETWDSCLDAGGEKATSPTPRDQCAAADRWGPYAQLPSRFLLRDGVALNHVWHRAPLRMVEKFETN